MVRRPWRRSILALKRQRTGSAPLTPDGDFPSRLVTGVGRRRTEIETPPASPSPHTNEQTPSAAGWDATARFD